MIYIQKLKLNQIHILKTIYKKEIKEKENGLWAHIQEGEKLQQKISDYLEEQMRDPLLHLGKISNYLIHQCNKRLCIVIDNADQLAEEIQKDVFILGHSLQRNLKVMTLISLREGYFYKFKNKPPFDAYHSTVFHITAPSYREVLNKRIKYVIQNYKFPQAEVDGKSVKFKFQEGSLKQLFINLYKTLFDYINSEILSFLEETSYPNIRNGLDKFKFFLLSGHTKTNLYMSFHYGNEGKGNIPIWEFVKSVASESNYYYHTNKSLLFNLFYPSENNKNHFTKIRLLECLIEKNNNGTKNNNFQAASEIIDIFVKAGYTSEVILEELNLLYTAGLIFTNDFVSDIESEININSNSKIGITQSGVFYIKNILNKFYYYDLTLQDTPIYNEKYFDKISEVFPESDSLGHRDLLGRKKAVEIFIEYLNEQELLDHNRKENDYNIKYLDKDIIDSIKRNGLKNDIDRIGIALSKNA